MHSAIDFWSGGVYNVITINKKEVATMTKASEMYDFLVEQMIATEEFISGAICVNGFNRETMEAVLFYNTGYHNFNQFIECEMEEEEE